jgi:hypothetical protein
MKASHNSIYSATNLVILSVATCDYMSQTLVPQGHRGIGPDRAGPVGIEAYANVPTKPTNNSNALSERFIFFLLRVCRS